MEEPCWPADPVTKNLGTRTPGPCLPSSSLLPSSCCASQARQSGADTQRPPVTVSLFPDGGAVFHFGNTLAALAPITYFCSHWQPLQLVLDCHFSSLLTIHVSGTPYTYNSSFVRSHARIPEDATSTTLLPPSPTRRYSCLLSAILNIDSPCLPNPTAICLINTATMSSDPGPKPRAELDEEKTPQNGSPPPSLSPSGFVGGEDILALQDLDPAMNRKMHLVNNVSACLWPPLPDRGRC